MPSASVKDVAARAGVSVGSVSNVLNHPERVSARLRDRVQSAISELEFVRNNAARQLRLGRSTGIGVVVLDVGNPFFASLIRGAEARASAGGLHVLIGNSDEDPEREADYLTMFEQERIRGVIISPAGNVIPRLLRLRERGTPVVLVDRKSTDRAFSSVAVDDRAGGRLAAEHLLQQGFNRIAFAGGPFGIEQVLDRHRGATDALPGGTIERLETESLSIEEGRRIGSLLAARSPLDRPRAVFAANDLIALGLLQSLTHAGIDVPDEMALIGYDDIGFAAAAAVPISSIRQPARDIGATAMDLLIELIEHPQTPPSHVEFQPVLVPRQSTGTR